MKTIGCFKIRCHKNDQRLIQGVFRRFQNEIEADIEAQTTSGLDDILSDFNHALVVLPSRGQPLPDAGYTSDTLEDGGQMKLDVPDELRDFSCVVAWQDLQAGSKTFMTPFISGPEQKAIEVASRAKMIPDEGQKVIFIGASSDENAQEVQLRLTALLQDYLAPRTNPVDHVFFIDFDGQWAIDVRDIVGINPKIMRSTILDPWFYTSVDELFEQSVCGLRVCRDEPSSITRRGHLWSLFGPDAGNVFNGRQPRGAARAFEGIKVTDRLPARHQPPGRVHSWLDRVATPNTSNIEADTPSSTRAPMHLDFDGGVDAGSRPQQSGIGPDAPIDLIKFDEDAPIPLGNLDKVGPVPLDGPDEDAPIALNQFVETSSPAALGIVQQVSLLDLADDILQNPTSNLQRPMQPRRRQIVVPKPDSLHEPTTEKLSPTNIELDGEQGFVASLRRLMQPLPRKSGMIRLSAEIGRFFARDVPQTGQATNSKDQPAQGWSADKLRARLQLQSSSFTRVLSSIGSDVDFIATMKIPATDTTIWKPVIKSAFIDFWFEVRCQEQKQDLVVEVNTEDYTCVVRKWNDTYGGAFVHCLGQNWDFQARLSRDHAIECKEYWGPLAQALVDSLQVNSPVITFQHAFTEAPGLDNHEPVIVTNARVRQVCRFQSRDEKAYLDVTRILPLEKVSQDDVYCKMKNIKADQKAGVFSQWYEVSISSVRLEEILKQNENLVPGDHANWTVDQLQEEGIFTDLYNQAVEVVKRINGVGVDCDNGIEERQRLEREEISRRSQGVRKKYAW